MRHRPARLVGACSLLSAGLTLVCACRDSATTPPEEAPEPPRTLQYTIWDFDSYAGDDVVRAYWDATPMLEPTFPPRPWPDVREVRLEVSSQGPNGPYRVAASRHRVGADSATVGGVVNGILHHFRIVSCDSAGLSVGMSPIIEIIPGPSPSPLVAFPAFQRQYASPSLAWSPGGDRLAFVKADGCVQANVYMYDFATASIRQVTDFEADEQSVSHVGWSPDGSALVFGYSPSRVNYLLDYRIWTHALASDSSQSVTAGRYDGSPAWVTNRDIVFVRYTNSPRAPEILWLTLGTPPTTTQLTFDGKVWKTDLAVSRDGYWIAYSGSGDGNGAIYVLPVGGGERRKLTRSFFGDDIHPAWHPDGRTLYFASHRSGHYEIWSVNSGTGSLRQITRSQVRSLAHFGPAVTTDGTRLACFASRGSLTDVVVLAP